MTQSNEEQERRITDDELEKVTGGELRGSVKDNAVKVRDEIKNGVNDADASKKIKTYL